MKNEYKQLFNKMKEIGYFGNYETYEAYSNKEQKEEQKVPRYIKAWKRTLSVKDKGRFNKMFE